jgi:hypothetical protein
MSDVTDSVLIMGSRRRGRPRVDQRTEPVMTRLPLPVYDEIVKTATRRGESVSAVVRTLLTIRIKRELL